MKKIFSDLLYRLRALFGHSRVEEDLDEELRFHYDRHIERGIRSGLTPEEARRQARLEVGIPDSVKEECRDARGVRLIESIAADIRYALRLIAKSPAFAGVVIYLALWYLMPEEPPPAPAFDPPPMQPWKKSA